MFGSYGLDQCLDLVEQALASGRGLPKPEGDEWLEGTGVALAMLDSGPPDRAPLGRRDAAAARRDLPPGRRLHGDGQRLGHVASADRRRRARHARGPHRDHQCRYRPDALRHRHLRQHGDGRRRPGGGADRRRAARRASSTSPAAISAASRSIAACRTTRHLRQPEGSARRAPCRRHRGGPSLRGQAQSLSVAAVGRLQRAGRAASPCIASPAKSRSCKACMPPTSAG